MKWYLAKGGSPLEGSGLPLATAMLRSSGDAAAEDEDDEELGDGQQFEEPINALVQNCTMLHNIVGPACVFLRQSFAQSQIVCTHTYKCTFLRQCMVRTQNISVGIPSGNLIIIVCLFHFQSNTPFLPITYFHNDPIFSHFRGCCAMWYTFVSGIATCPKESQSQVTLPRPSCSIFKNMVINLNALSKVKLHIKVAIIDIL